MGDTSNLLLNLRVIVHPANHCFNFVRRFGFEGGTHRYRAHKHLQRMNLIDFDGVFVRPVGMFGCVARAVQHREYDAASLSSGHRRVYVFLVMVRDVIGGDLLAGCTGRRDNPRRPRRA